MVSGCVNLALVLFTIKLLAIKIILFVYHLSCFVPYLNQNNKTQIKKQNKLEKL